MTSKLKPCPFCGERKMLMSGLGDRIVWLKCLNKQCGADGPMRKTKEEAIAAWNRRTK